MFIFDGRAAGGGADSVCERLLETSSQQAVEPARGGGLPAGQQPALESRPGRDLMSSSLCV